MTTPLRSAVSRLAARVHASPFAKPAGRITLVALGLAGLAAVGSAASVRPTAAAAFAAPSALAPAASAPLPGLAAPLAPPLLLAPPPVASGAEGEAHAPQAASATASASHAPATPEDPVILNTAALEDLRRLPGIGEKRATAILALRQQLGRFRAVEDLLKVKGIGRATLKRLRPLVRLDARAAGDAG